MKMFLISLQRVPRITCTCSHIILYHLTLNGEKDSPDERKLRIS